MEFGRRWEDGQEYLLPQDYADMLGWEELSTLVEEAFAKAETPERVLLYCENYGQAGAVSHYTSQKDLPSVQSFADSYRLWVNPKTEANTLIYVNDELGEDVANAFERIELIGTVAGPYAREAGTRVYLCQGPQIDVQAFWKERVTLVQSYWK